MRTRLFGALFLLCGLAAPIVQTHSAADARADANGASSAEVMYVSGGQLWLRDVHGLTARRVPTPWRMSRPGGVVSAFYPSPDGRRVAVDNARSKLSVVNLRTGHITPLVTAACGRQCSPPSVAWSPDGRYLGFIVARATADQGPLRIWDSRAGTTRTLVRAVSAFTAPVWSHAGDRIAVAQGHFDTLKDVYPSIITVSLAGHVVGLGKGDDARWSPDDRFLGIIRPNYCGANTCDEDVLVERSTGGAPIMLRRHSSSLFDNPIWSPRTSPYTFDRWQLNGAGHPLRQVAGKREIVLSWTPDGAHLALQSYHPYEGTPDSLILWTPPSTRSRLYTDGSNQGCGACSKDVYTVVWGGPTLFAWTTPTYPTPQNVVVRAKVFVGAFGGETRTPVALPKADLVSLLGFVDGESTLVIHAGHTLYAYGVFTHRLTIIARRVSDQYATAVLEPSGVTP